MLADYFKTVEGDLRLFSQRDDTATAIENMSRSFNMMKSGVGDGATAIYQKAYVTGNPNPAKRYLTRHVGRALAGSYDRQHKRLPSRLPGAAAGAGL